ncbi:hypothetical protein CA606_18540 [Caulobacter vibrioides]|uniref:Bacteriophage tail tape measure C-terminal domain-containing protein n=1 Tax=Caulobacter vibrioides TaxID=155892 RepID=A0A290MYV1_CAUVI|nr:hypothetical protein [Caulobacter vibrioides]ATC34169.1 hypothetical protein CA606_18540 [Caulobacter vibrioides]
MTIDVAVRLGLEGGQAATRGIEDFGAKGAKSFKEMRREASALPPHLVAVSRGVGAVKDKVDDLAASTGAFGSVAESFGKYGLFISAGAAALGLAAGYAKTAIEGAVAYGDAIGDASQKLGVGAGMLQEYRFAMIKVGGEAGDADAAIGGFTKTLGLAEAGYKKSLAAFKQLGFSRQDIKSFKDVDEALRAVAERVANLGNERQRQAIAEKLGLGPMIPLLREGADGMAELFQRARDLGWVMSDEVIAKAGDAADQLEDLKQVIDVQLNTALIEAAPLLVSMSGAMVDGAKSAGQFAQELTSLKSLIDDWIASRPSVKLSFEVTWKFLNKVEDFFQGISKGSLEKLGFNKLYLDQFYGDAKDFPADDGGAVADRRSGADGSKQGDRPKGTGQLGSVGAEEDAARAAANAQRERKRALEASARTTSAIAAADARELAAQRQYAGTLEQMLETELAALDDAQARRMAEIDRDAAEGRLDKLKVAELKRAEADAYAAEREVLQRRAFDDTQQRRLADEKALAEVTQQLLGLASAGARTAEERRAIELEILESQQKIAKAELERALAADGAHDEAWKDARRNDQQRLFDAQRGSVERGTMGPLESYADRLVRTNAEVKESLQAVAVDGFKMLNDGIVDATLNAGTLGDVFADVGKMIVASLEHVVIQMLVIKPMVDALMRSVNGGGGGGFLNTLISGVGTALGGALGAPRISAASAADLGGANLVAQLSKGRAGGGPVYRGDVRPIHEQGFERIAAFSRDSYVMDAARTAREIADSSVSSRHGGERPVSVSLNNNAPMPLQATATERDDGAGGRRLDIDLVELIDSRVSKGKREMFDGSMDSAFQSKFGIRPRLNGG